MSYTIGAYKVNGLSTTIGQAIGQRVNSGTVASRVTLNPIETDLGVYNIGADSMSNPPNGSNTINVSQDVNNSMNFTLHQSWLSNLSTSFQSSLTATNNTYQRITTYTFQTLVGNTYQSISKFNSFQNQMNTTTDNIDARRQTIPNTVLSTYVGEHFMLQIKQAP